MSFLESQSVLTVSVGSVYKCDIDQPFQLVADLIRDTMAPSRTEREMSVVTEWYQHHELLTPASYKLIREKHVLFICCSSRRPATLC
jgi:hypothetical protein